MQHACSRSSAERELKCPSTALMLAAARDGRRTLTGFVEDEAELLPGTYYGPLG